MAAKKAFITGIAGFVGSHLAELLLSRGVEVYGLLRPRSNTGHIEAIINKLHLVSIGVPDSYFGFKT